MNRLFLLFYCVVFIVRLTAFLRGRKRLPGKQQLVMSIMYGLTILFFAMLQFQQAELIPIGRFLNVLAPWVKMWVDQLL